MTGTAVEQFIIIAICIVNTALASVATSGNALVLHAVWKRPALRSPSILLLCGLASTDLCVGLIAQPLFIAGRYINLYSRSENLKLMLGNAYKTIGLSLCGTSLLIMTGISIERIIAIVKPLQYPSIVTSSRVTCILLAILAANALIACTRFWDSQVLYAFISSSVFSCFSMSIICHATMYKIMRRHRLQIHSQIQAFEKNTTRTSMPSLRKSAFNAFVVFIVLVICYFPYLVVYSVYFIGKAGDLELWFLLSMTVVFLNSALYPLLYCWRIREIRLAVLQTLRRLFSAEWITKYCRSPLANSFFG